MFVIIILIILAAMSRCLFWGFRPRMHRHHHMGHMFHDGPMGHHHMHMGNPHIHMGGGMGGHSHMGGHGFSGGMGHTGGSFSGFSGRGGGGSHRF